MYELGKPNAAMANSTEKVLFAENVHYPGVPIVYRTPDEKSANPDRINLDRFYQSQFFLNIITFVLNLMCFVFNLREQNFRTMFDNIYFLYS